MLRSKPAHFRAEHGRFAAMLRSHRALLRAEHAEHGPIGPCSAAEAHRFRAAHGRIATMLRSGRDILRAEHAEHGSCAAVLRGRPAHFRAEHAEHGDWPPCSAAAPRIFVRSMRSMGGSSGRSAANGSVPAHAPALSMRPEGMSPKRPSLNHLDAWEIWASLWHRSWRPILWCCRRASRVRGGSSPASRVGLRRER